MFEPHPNNPKRRSVSASPAPASDLTGIAADPSSRDRRLIQQALHGIGKQPMFAAPDARPIPNPQWGQASSMLTVLELLGHSSECARLARAGLVTSCHCGLKAADDPAVVVGLAVHFARSAIMHGVPLPASVAERLTKAVEAGDPACRSVATWLADLGLLELAPHLSAEGGVR